MTIDSIPSRLYIDYDMAIELYNKMGDVPFIKFLENHYVISMDKDCYYFLLSIKQDYDNDKLKKI
jgi:hypothetical protein